MQIKRNTKNKNHDLIWQKNILRTTFAQSLSILVLSAIIIVTPSLSTQFQANSNSDSSKYSLDDNGNDNINTNNSQIAVFPANSKPYGLTYGEWTSRWWQWGYSVPKNINPAYDDTGKNCAQKQNGPVWFLAGTFGHSVNRVCDIPAGKAILFPILNSECSFAEFPKLKTLSELSICAKTIQDQVTTLNASIDGIPIPNLEEYRIRSPPFNFTLPENNILEMPANVTTQAMADGNWVFLQPLSPGFHKIIFKGGVQQQTNAAGRNSNVSGSSSSFAFPSGWDFETIYYLKVKNSATNGYYSYSNQSSIIEQQNVIITATQHNIVKLLADMVRNRLYDAVNFLEITSKDPVIQNVSFANYITKRNMGIPASMDLPKRKVAQDILTRDKDFETIYFLTPRADIYIGEPFSDQKQLPRLNYADRDWYKGVTALNNTYISAVFMSASIHVPATAIATPIYSLQDNTPITSSKTNKSISGYWVGISDLRSIRQSIKNLNLTNGERIIIVDHNGTAIVDYSPSPSSSLSANDNIPSTKLEDFSYLSSIKSVRKGNAGSIFETVNGIKMLSIYQPIQLGNRFWGVILIKPVFDMIGQERN